MQIKSYFNKNELIQNKDVAKEGLIQFINYILSEMILDKIKKNKYNEDDHAAHQLFLMQQSIETIDQEQKIEFSISFTKGSYLKEESINTVINFFKEILRIETQYSLRLRNLGSELDISASEIRKKILREIIENVTVIY